MVPAPKRLDTVEVHNKTAAPVSITVVYDDQLVTKGDVSETFDIEAGSSKVFGKELDMGGWTAVAPVKRVELTHSNQLHHWEPSVNGVVKKLDVNVTPAYKLETGSH